jgi:uncharacterized membrane protein YphA (DoxX/SURF4 family)
VLSIVLALAMLSTGFAKLAGEPMMAAEFRVFGYPLWFMTLIGGLEILAVALVLVPWLSYVGASLIVCMMIGTMFAHLTHGKPGYATVPTVWLVLAVIFGSLRGLGRSSSAFEM